MLSAAWSTEDARWLVEIERADTGERLTMSCGWLYSAGGYYRYDQGFTPEFEGRERFAGEIVHPQHWPEDLDYSGKRVVIIGSGATAVTLVPSMAGTAAHVTMLQRSPTYVDPAAVGGRHRQRVAQPARREAGLCDHPAQERPAAAHDLSVVPGLPAGRQRFLRFLNAQLLPENYPVDEHFKPAYNPWDQRLCVVPDGDLFKALSAGDASVVTDRIATFTEGGIRLESGRELEADIIVTATGLNLHPLGGVTMRVDGVEVNAADTAAYKGLMPDGVPNFAFAIGYTTSSWTLKIGLVCDHFCPPGPP